MQLKKKYKPVRNTLAVATASLLGSVAHSPTVQAEGDWEIDSSLMYYAETDRVSLFEPIIRARKDMGNDSFLNIRLVVDTLTGSSANGAIATGSAQTFTTPSGNSTYSTPANTTPLDDTFHDTRVAVSGEWEKPINRDWTAIYGLNFSTEYDYQSVGLSATLNRDFNQKNSTLSIGVAYNADTVEPVGGAPVGLTAMPTFPATKATQGSSLNKDVYDILVGWTQVLGRKDIMQFNFNYGNESGYLSDPYKILSVVDGTTGDLVASDPYLYEKRPDDRTRQAFFTRWSHQFDSDVLRVAYRYFWDDWGITSHTIDTHYRWELGGSHYVEPHLRYYTQTAADFYNTSLVDGSIPEFASADYRLGDLTTTTVGMKYGFELGKNSEIGIRAEMINQQADPSAVIGNQSSQDLVPDVEALLIQFNYSLIF